MSDKKKQLGEAEKRIISEMTIDEGFKEFFHQYSKDSVEYFISRYAHHKANLEVYGDFTKFSQRNLMSEWLKSAWECLNEIQHKKLFDLSCKWHAEETGNLTGIEVSLDFKTVGSYILDYDEIPPISEDEVDFYMEYLNTGTDPTEFHTYYFEYQDYHELRKRYEENSLTGIEYYDYHNIYSGNHRLMAFADVREEKERVYIKIAVDHRRKNAKKESGKKEKPYLSSSDEDLIKFAKKIDDRKTAAFIEDWKKWLYSIPDSSIEWAVHYLNSIYPEKVPVKAHLDWQEAVHQAALAHKHDKVCEMLPVIYDEYLLKKSSGILLTSEEDRKSDDRSLWYKELVLEGRELSGEPRDFDF